MTLNLNAVISKTVDKAIEQDQRVWALKLATLFENQALRLRAVFGGKPKWGNVGKKQIRESAKRSVDFGAILKAHEAAAANATLIPSDLVEEYGIESSTAERIVLYYGRFRKKYGKPHQGDAWGTSVTLNGNKYDIRVIV